MHNLSNQQILDINAIQMWHFSQEIIDTARIAIATSYLLLLPFNVFDFIGNVLTNNVISLYFIDLNVDVVRTH